MKIISKTLMRPRTLLPLAAALAFGLSACGGGGGGVSSGTANFALTDAPVCNGLQNVFVTVTAIELIGQSGTYSLTLPKPVQVNLTTLTNGAKLFLGSISVPAGTYQQLRLILAANTGNGGSYANYVVPTGSTTQVPLTTPSAQQSGYKINGQFTVAANGQVNLTIDFNACRSVVMAGKSGQYILKPVLNLVDDEQSGSITGYLPTAAAGAVVMAEDNQGHIVKTTVAAAGAASTDPSTFTLAPLPANSTGYNVVIAPPAPSSGTPSPNIAPNVVLSVPVTVGQVTTLGSSSSPLPTITSTQDATYSGTITLEQEADTLIVAQESLNSVTISIAQTNGVESTSSTTTKSYAMVLPTVAPNVASYTSGALKFTQSSTAPAITIQAYASDGESGNTTAANGPIRLSGSSDTTFEMNH
ncbi:DUF4382 domain-containing protein [Tibeticola sp.]|uniref:DUF4382 domain-containing protein n=1 Tax=Tibeticola sp. TaxID=2005368 RepID=UPI00258DBD61|nr:DUF4382 domain-containing protein [Tibeticola sp.]MCI4439721.1 DUF4382 domain-containing protein [Tibeticola sp.]